MSGNGFMDLCACSQEVDGCSELEGELCHEFSACLVSRAAGVIAGVKPGALFNFVPRGECRGRCPSEHVCLKVGEVVAAYQRELPHWGVELVVLFAAKRKVALFAYRPELLQLLLACPDERKFLAERGYDTAGPAELVASLWKRMHAYYQAAAQLEERPGYPHEVGLLLGYPLEDVRGFMAGEQETCRGPWKAYGDAGAARRRFGRLALHEARCQALYAGGASFGELFGTSLAL